ncbi:ABC transporter permease [Rhodococcus sp. B7740]|uniref:ABC transporter permease n=1 Tax=Rhodococcus sp. B7740 TaxID=1564114 RepID=UPI0005EBD1B4|nr:ABC transporter permease [Rhodococcus sp. B7740]
MDRILLDMFVTGLPLVPVVLGIYMVFRIKADFDLTVEGSFVTGGAVCAISLGNGVEAWVAILFGVVAAAAAGFVTSILHLLLKIPVLLAGLIMSIGLFSVNLHILGQPTVSLALDETIFSPFDSFDAGAADLATIALMGTVIALTMAAFALFLKTETGLALRATGDNNRMSRSQGVNDKFMTVLTLVIANGLAGLGAGLAVQHQSYADVNMGLGTFVAGVGAVLLGELMFRPSGSKLLRIVLAVVVGTLAYRLILVASLRFGLPASDLKGVMALTLVVAIAFERYMGPVAGRFRVRREPVPPAARTREKVN